MPKARQKRKPKSSDVYKQMNKLNEYKVSKTDEKIIRRYILLLSDTAPVDYLIKVMSYVFRITVEDVHKILDKTSDAELCRIAVLREKWQHRSNSKLGYVSRRILEK